MSHVQLHQGTSHGRPNLYQGTNPGTGGLSGPSGSRSLKPGGFPFGSMRPSRVVNQTLGFQTNGTINYAYIVRRFKSGFDKALNQGQYVFMRKKQPVLGEKMYTMLNLPQLNFFLKKCAAFEKGDAYKEWVPMGVVQGEIGGDVRDQPQERLLNITVSGRTRTFNTFGDKCRDGTEMYMVLVQKTHKLGEREPYTLSLGGATEEVFFTNDNVPYHQYHQFVPYAHAIKSEPTKNNLFTAGVIGKDDDVVKSFYIGRVGRCPNLSVQQLNTKGKRAFNQVDRLVTLPMLEVFLDYDLPHAPTPGVPVPVPVVQQGQQQEQQQGQQQGQQQEEEEGDEEKEEEAPPTP